MEDYSYLFDNAVKEEKPNHLIFIKDNHEKVFIKDLRRNNLRQLINFIPEEKKSYHIISNGASDCFDFIPIFIEKFNYIDEIIATTWSINHNHIEELLGYYDNNKIGKIQILTGDEFKTRRSASYAYCVIELKKRNQDYLSINNHAKLVLISNEKLNQYIVIDSSANFTTAKRIENYVMNNDKALFDFHKTWITHYFKRVNK